MKNKFRDLKIVRIYVFWALLLTTLALVEWSVDLIKLAWSGGTFYHALVGILIMLIFSGFLTVAAMVNPSMENWLRGQFRKEEEDD